MSDIIPDQPADVNLHLQVLVRPNSPAPRPIRWHRSGLEVVPRPDVRTATTARPVLRGCGPFVVLARAAGGYGPRQPDTVTGHRTNRADLYYRRPAVRTLPAWRSGAQPNLL